MAPILRRGKIDGRAKASRGRRGGHWWRQPRLRPLRLERLEERALLDANFYPNFPADVAQNLCDPQQGVQKFVNDVFDAGTQDLPFLGSAGAVNQLAHTQFINEAGQKILNELDPNSYTDANTLDTELEKLFGQDTVVITQAPGLRGIGVEILLSGNSLQDPSSQIRLDTGLDGLPFTVNEDGGIVFTIGYDYRLAFNYGGTAESFFLTDTNLNGKDHELEITVGATLSNGFAVDATIGFLDAEITDNSSHLDVTFMVESLHSTPSLSLGGAGAHLDLHVQTGAGGLDYQDYFPSIQADFVLDWDFLNNSPPTVALENIKLGLGSVLSDVLQPLVGFVQPILEPIQPVIDVGNEPIPVISDLSHLIGGPDVTLFDLAGLASGELPPAYQQLVDLGLLTADVAKLVDDFNTQQPGELVLELGSYTINDLATSTSGDLLALNPAVDPVTNPDEEKLQTGFDFGLLNNYGGLDLAAIKTMVEGWELPGDLGDRLGDVLDRLDDGIKYSFPILDDPVYAAISLLMGNDFDVFTFTGQATNVQSNAPGGEFDLPIGLSAGLGGYITLDASIQAGYDTYGIRHFLSTGDAQWILNGFYLEDTTHFNISGSIYASAGANWADFFEAGISGGVSASFGMNNANLDTDGDHKVHRTDNPILFDVSGGLYAFLNAYVQVGVEVFGEFVGYREEFNLVDVTIGSFSTDDVPNPFIPVDTLNLAGDYKIPNTPDTVVPRDDPNDLDVIEPNGVLTLNVGPDAGKRNVKPAEFLEVYSITSQFDENNNEVILVSAFGFTQRFHGVEKIVADAGTGNDRIVIAEEVTVPVELHGGEGNDQLRYLGSGQALLYGDDHDDLLESGTGDDNYLYGGDGHDVLKAGSIEGTTKYTNYLYGGEGDDDLYAGDNFQNNWLYGEGGRDWLFASDHGDWLDGGVGDDFFQTGAGGDFVICGEGDDQVTWEVGSQTAYIYGRLQTDPPTFSDHGFDAVGIKGTNDPDAFEVSELSNFVQVLHGGTQTGVILAQVEGVSIEGQLGADTITVHDLSNTSIEDVRINTGDIIDPDNFALDQIFVEGTAWPDTVVVSLQDAALYPPPHVGDPILGGITVMELVPHYKVKMANVLDHVELTTFTGADQVEVHGISGPTWIETAEGDDQIHVVANAAQAPYFVGDSAFLAPLEVEAGTGANRMFFTIDGFPQLTQETVHLTDQTLTAASLIPEGVLFTATGGDFSGGIWLDTGSTHDTVYVQNTLPNVNTLVTTGAGADTIVLSSDATTEGNLATIEGPIKVDAGSGGNYLHLVDHGATSGNAFVQVLSMSVLGLAGPSDNIEVLYGASGGTYSQIRLYASDDPSVNEAFRIDKPNGPFILYGDRGNETVNVEATFFYLDIFAGKGDDVVNVGKFNSLDSILGSISVFGEGGTDELNVNDHYSVSGTTYTLTSASLHRLNAALIMFDNKLERLNVNMTRHGDVVAATQIPKKTAVRFEDFGGDDYLFGPDKPAEFNIYGPDVGVVNSSLGFSAIENLAGGAKKDRFTFVDGASLSGSISGGNERDTLDYSAVTYDVRVNFLANTAINVGSVFDIEDAIGGSRNDLLIGDNLRNCLIGGPGNDVLVGHAGKDMLFGDLGRDVLIGGADKDQLSGGEDDDILIGGTTLYDYSVAALLAIMDEWSRLDLDYAGRINHLRNGGGLNGSILLNSTTVFDDAAKDVLEGGPKLDWFFAKLSSPNKDKLLDYAPQLGEQVDKL